jgi:hypothetical protein
VNLRKVPTGSEVRCSVLGQEFPAIVTGSPADGLLPVEPTIRNVSRRHVRSSQVKEILARPTRSGQLSLADVRGDGSDPFRTRPRGSGGGAC